MVYASAIPVKAIAGLLWLFSASSFSVHGDLCSSRHGSLIDGGLLHINDCVYDLELLEGLQLGLIRWLAKMQTIHWQKL